MYVLGQCEFRCFVYPAYLSCVSHSIDICTVGNKNIRNMHAVSTNHVADILHFRDKYIAFIRVLVKHLLSNVITIIKNLLNILPTRKTLNFQSSYGI